MISIISIYHTSYWLASSEVISQLWLVITIHLRAAEEKQNGFCRYIVTNKLTLWAASYSACVVYTKTIIHLSVGESSVYLPPLRWILVNYYTFNSTIFSDRVKAYNEFSKDTQGHGLSCHVWPQCMISKDNHVKFARFALLPVSEEAKTWLPFFLFNI